MSKLALIALFFVFNAVCGTKVFLGNNNKLNVGIYAQLQKIESNTFGKNLLDTVALQVKNKAPLSDIAQLLAELKSDLQSQQARDDQIHAEREQDCADSIAAYVARINYASSEITDATARISALTNRIAQLHDSIEQYKEHIGETEQAIADAIATREHRAEQFESRNVNHQSVIDALDIILEKLAAVGPQALQDEAAMIQLAKIGKKNPIAAFVQVAAALSPESWENIRSKLQGLRDATAASMAEDADQEAKEISAHNDLLTSLNALLKSLRDGLAQDEQELVEQEADLAQQEIRLSTNTDELHNATEGKAAKEHQCEDWRQQYQRDSQQRSEEIAIVEQVQDIFARKLDTAQGYLRDRMEADRQ